MSSVLRSAFVAMCALVPHTHGYAGDRELGQYLASECATCHQRSEQASGGIPAIVGWTDDQFVAVMLTYKNKDRDNQAMQTIAARLSREDIEALAAFLGGLEKQD